jgi:diguanylate cyclase
VDAINRGHVYHYILKPWRTEELLQVLRNAAEKSSLERNRDQLLDQLRQLNRKLEDRVAERTRELEEANKLLQQRSRELERLALIDPLTGLNNRRLMDDLAISELKRRGRYPSPVAIGLIDIDHFKQVNTDYLHTGGDEVLKGLAKLLTSSIREADSVGRYGGEEFLVIAPETNEEGAAHLAERIRSTVANTPIEYGGAAVSITASIGMAVADVGVPADFKEMYRVVVKALADAKNAGRNRSVVRNISSAAEIKTQPGAAL